MDWKRRTNSYPKNLESFERNLLKHRVDGYVHVVAILVGTMFTYSYNTSKSDAEKAVARAAALKAAAERGAADAKVIFANFRHCLSVCTNSRMHS